MLTRYLSGRGLFPSLVALLIMLSLALNAQSPGFFLNEWKERNAEIPDYQIKALSNDPATVTVSVDLSDTLNKVPNYIFGNNAVTWDNGLMKNSTAVKDLKNLNTHVLRWPGGSLSDNYFWDTPYGQRPSDIPATISPWYGPSDNSWEMSVNDYYNMLSQTNSTGLIVVNYGYARYGTGPDPVAKAAHMAADWVRYDNGRSKFWEIGNENFGTWESGYEIDLSKNQDGQPQFISGQLYGQHCRIFIDSMRAAAAETGAEIKIGVVAFDAESVSWSQIQSNWNEEMMAEVGDKADFLSVHSYFTPYNENSSVSKILNSHTVPGEIMSVLENDMAQVAKPMIPVAMTEWNIFAVGSWQQVSYINGMLAALTLGEFVNNNYGLATRWDLVNGWSNGNDHAMFSTGGEPGVDPYNPRAVFFYMYYFQKFIGDRMLQSDVNGNNDVIAYASTFSSGETGLALINKSRSAETLEIDLNNGKYGLKYYYITLTGGTDNGDFSRKVLVNGIEEMDEQGGGPDNYESIKAFARTSREGIKIELPPLSVVYVMVDAEVPLSYVYSEMETDSSLITLELSEEVLPVDNPQGFTVSVNGTNVSIANITVDPTNPSLILISLTENLNGNDAVTISYSGNDILSLENIPLLPFSNENVTNHLPGDPYNITFIFRNSESGAFIENCAVNFNSSLINTDQNGEAIFHEQRGEYLLSASKPLLSTLTDQVFFIESDTSINVYMDSVSYNVSFILKNEATSNLLPFVHLSSNGQNVQTDEQGKALLSMFGGTHAARFSKQNYFDKTENFNLSSDTTLIILMEQSHIKLKFRLKSGDQPIPDASVSIGDLALITSAVGTCTFESVAINAETFYQIEKENFFPVSGSISTKSDTSLDIQMEKSVANLSFQISEESGKVSNAKTIIGQDTAWFDVSGICKFYSYAIGQSYNYNIHSEKHRTYSGSVELNSDTTVVVMLTPNGTELHVPGSGIHIYPNPAKALIQVNLGRESYDQLYISDISGRILHISPIENASFSLDVSEFQSGTYFISFINDLSGRACIKFIKQ